MQTSEFNASMYKLKNAMQLYFLAIILLQCWSAVCVCLLEGLISNYFFQSQIEIKEIITAVAYLNYSLGNAQKQALLFMRMNEFTCVMFLVS